MGIRLVEVVPGGVALPKLRVRHSKGRGYESQTVGYALDLEEVDQTLPAAA